MPVMLQVHEPRLQDLPLPVPGAGENGMHSYWWLPHLQLWLLVLNVPLTRPGRAAILQPALCHSLSNQSSPPNSVA